MIHIDAKITPRQLLPRLEAMIELSGKKINLLQSSWDTGRGTPVFTVDGIYTSRGWTEWTQGFQFGSAILQFEMSGDDLFLHLGRQATVGVMATHVSHTGVHDHGFNNVSTYGNLLRLMNEGTIPEEEWERKFYELALKMSGATQAARWTTLDPSSGYIYSFNGPHSLFADTVRSLRSLALAHQLGHVLMGERDRKISLLRRLIQHAESTARYNVYFGGGRDIYDIRGRVAHESIFNLNDGSYRCPSTQQGYSPFTTWTRGLAWILCGFPEEMEFLSSLPDSAFGDGPPKDQLLERFLDVSRAVADFYIEQSPVDGIPYWDTGAPGLSRMGDYLSRPADPFNAYEPVDSSAAAIAAQGLVRLGHWMNARGLDGATYLQAGLTVASHLFDAPYLSTEEKHQGLILHSVYHRPNGWDHAPEGTPRGESSMWGDYHARELVLLLWRMATGKSYYTFFGNH